MRFLAWVLCKLLFRLQAKGVENIPRRGGFILASNHVSYLDPVVVGVSCPRKLNYMARHDLFTIPIFGAFLRQLRSFPVKRGTSDIASIKQGLKYLKQAGGLLVFPEGGRSLDSSLMKPEPGISLIAAKSNVPVIPVFVKGTEKALSRNARYIRLVKIYVYFGKPLYFKNQANRVNYQNFANKIMQEIKGLA